MLDISRYDLMNFILSTCCLIQCRSNGRFSDAPVPMPMADSFRKDFYSSADGNWLVPRRLNLETSINELEQKQTCQIIVKPTSVARIHLMSRSKLPVYHFEHFVSPSRSSNWVQLLWDMMIDFLQQQMPFSLPLIKSLTPKTRLLFKWPNGHLGNEVW